MIAINYCCYLFSLVSGLYGEQKKQPKKHDINYENAHHLFVTQINLNIFQIWNKHEPRTLFI